MSRVWDHIRKIKFYRYRLSKCSRRPVRYNGVFEDVSLIASNVDE